MLDIRATERVRHALWCHLPLVLNEALQVEGHSGQCAHTVQKRSLQSEGRVQTEATGELPSKEDGGRYWRRFKGRGRAGGRGDMQTWLRSSDMSLVAKSMSYGWIIFLVNDYFLRASATPCFPVSHANFVIRLIHIFVIINIPRKWLMLFYVPIILMYIIHIMCVYILVSSLFSPIITMSLRRNQVAMCSPNLFL